MRPTQIGPHDFNFPGISRLSSYARGAGERTFSHGSSLELYRDADADPSRAAHEEPLPIESWIVHWQLNLLALLLRSGTTNGDSVVHG